MVPGPELDALLAGIDIHALTGCDAVEVLRARARQLSFEQARLLATMVEVGLCDPDAAGDEVSRLTESPPYAAAEIRAALAWTRRAGELGFAETLVLRMPAVFTALETGRIDRSKAWVFADLWTPAGDASAAAPAGTAVESVVPRNAAEPHPAQLARRVGVEVRVGLATLLGRNRHPGEIPGWGPVPAEVARTVVAAQRAAEWRFALTDPAGQLLLAGSSVFRTPLCEPGKCRSGRSR